MRNSTNFSDGAAREFEETELPREDAAVDPAVSPGAVEYVNGRALQALRDVRHMLSPEGIAIVDAVLDGLGFGGKGQRFDRLLFVVPPFAGEAEPLYPDQEDEFFENTLVN